MKCMICNTIIKDPENCHWSKDLNGSDAPIHWDCQIRKSEFAGEYAVAKKIFEFEDFILTLPKV